MPLGSSLGIHRFFCDRDSVASVVVWSRKGRHAPMKRERGEHANTCSSRERRKPWRGNLGAAALFRLKGRGERWRSEGTPGA